MAAPMLRPNVESLRLLAAITCLPVAPVVRQYPPSSVPGVEAPIGQETNAPPAEQKQAQPAAQDSEKCCGKDCCKHMKSKKDKASKKDKSETSGMARCK